MILHHVNHDVCTIWVLHLPTFAKALWCRPILGGFKGILIVYKYTLRKFNVVHLKMMVETKFGIYYSRGPPFSGEPCQTLGYVSVAEGGWMMMEKITVQQTMTAVWMVYAPQKIEKYKNIFTQFLETYIFNREYHRILKPQPTEIYLRLEDNYLRSRTSPFGARVIHLGNSPAIFWFTGAPFVWWGPCL